MPDLLDRIAELFFGPKATDVPDDAGHGHGAAPGADEKGHGHGDTKGHGDDKAHGAAGPVHGETKPGC